MSVGFLAIIAAIPIVLALVLMVGFRRPATRAMPLARQLMVAAQVVGGAMGNMVCIHNIFGSLRGGGPLGHGRRDLETALPALPALWGCGGHPGDIDGFRASAKSVLMAHSIHHGGRM